MLIIIIQEKKRSPWFISPFWTGQQQYNGIGGPLLTNANQNTHTWGSHPHMASPSPCAVTHIRALQRDGWAVYLLFVYGCRRLSLSLKSTELFCESFCPLSIITSASAKQYLCAHLTSVATSLLLRLSVCRNYSKRLPSDVLIPSCVPYKNPRPHANTWSAAAESGQTCFHFFLQRFSCLVLLGGTPTEWKKSAAISWNTPSTTIMWLSARLAAGPSDDMFLFFFSAHRFVGGTTNWCSSDLLIYQIE